MFLVTGKSHSGKSTVAYNMLVHNLRRSDDFTAILFSPDEPRELAVQKLFCIAMGRNALEVEDAIRRGDESAQRELYNTAAGLLDRVLINDQSLNFPQMLEAVQEASSYWNQPPSAVIIDYLELLHGTSDANGVAAKAQAAKRFAKDADVPLIVLHQTGRGASERGKPAGLHGGRFGGENESVAVLECYRPKDQTNLSPREQILLEKTDKYLLFVRYEDFVRDPQNQMNRIYDYFRVPRYNHNFNHIEQITHEDDKVYGAYDFHTMQNKLTINEPDFVEVLGKDTSMAIRQGYDWFYKYFNYK